MEPTAVERTFCFIDLAGFTALTDAHGDLEAVALLDRFIEMTRSVLGARDELVKSIGDAVMVAAVTPDEAVAVVQGLLARCQQAGALSTAPCRAHHGRAISRGQDYLGSAVNLAARVAAKSGGGQFLATRPVADAAQRSGIEVTALGPRPLRNITESVDLFEIDGPTGVSTDTLGLPDERGPRPRNTVARSRGSAILVLLAAPAPSRPTPAGTSPMPQASRPMQPPGGLTPPDRTVTAPTTYGPMPIDTQRVPLTYELA